MNINKVLIQHDHLVKRAATKFPLQEREDIAQEIRIWLFGALENYEDVKDKYPLTTYIRNQIGFCLRRLYFDVKVQERFERSHLPYFDQGVHHDEYDRTQDIVREIVSMLTPKDQVVLFSLIYDTKKRNYKQLSALMRLEYASFRNSVGKIKKITKKAIK